MNLTGKRLLILGGTRLMIHVVKTARRMGVYTVVTDMDPYSPAKTYANRAYDISTKEIDEVVKMALGEKIDGVFAGYDDQNTGYAIEICEKLALPFYATREQISITKNKISFKRLCRQYGVPVVKEYTLDEVEYPCVVKPADSYSAKGITICYSKDELDKAIEYALSFSVSGQYLIEKYVDYTMADCVNIDYLLIDGEIMLTLVGDKAVVKQGNRAPLTDAVFYPSKHVDEYITMVDAKMKKMFKSINMKNGVVFIESFFDEDGFAIYEMGYRVGGGQSSILLDEMCGVDYIKLLIQFALTGNMTKKKLKMIDPEEVMFACGLVVLIKPGTICKIENIDEIQNLPGVINITQYLNIGDSVDRKYWGTLGQTFARIHVVERDEQIFWDTLKKIKNRLHVKDGKGEEMIVRMR